jgi:uncharacterized protein YcbX
MKMRRRLLAAASSLVWALAGPAAAQAGPPTIFAAASLTEALQDVAKLWEARGEPRFIEAPGHRFSDVAMKVVSIIGLSSLHVLEAEAGMALDPLRFRANFYFSGGRPWAEFDWIGQEIQIGQARLRVVKRIVRCAATEVNPETGKRDADPPRDLRRHFGHADLGVYAEVLEGGQVALGDALEPMMLDL